MSDDNIDARKCSLGAVSYLEEQIYPTGRESLAVTKNIIAMFALCGVSCRIMRLQEKLIDSEDGNFQIFCAHVIRDLKEQWEELFDLASDYPLIRIGLNFKTMSAEDFYDYAEDGIGFAPLPLGALLSEALEKSEQLNSGCCINIFDGTQRKKTESEVKKDEEDNT